MQLIKQSAGISGVLQGAVLYTIFVRGHGGRCGRRSGESRPAGEHVPWDTEERTWVERLARFCIPLCYIPAQGMAYFPNSAEPHDEVISPALLSAQIA